MIRRYWFKFSDSHNKFLPIGVSRGCGLCAYNYDDAIELLKEKIFENTDLPPIENVIEDIDVSALDSDHILPNMGNIAIRGIWFPLGY